MEVVAYLPPHLLSYLQTVLGPENTLTATTGWSELKAVVRGRIVDVLVADPSADGHVTTAPLEQLIQQYPSVPVVIYTVLAPTTLNALVQLARAGVAQVVLNRFDDEPGRFREVLERAPVNALGELMLRELADPLAELPVTVCRAIEQLFRYPARFRSAADLARAAGMNPRALYRNLEPAGFNSSWVLVVSARLLRAYVYLRDPGRTIKEVAEKTGYYSAYQLTNQMQELAGIHPRAARHKVVPEEFIKRLAHEIQHRGRKRK